MSRTGGEAERQRLLDKLVGLKHELAQIQGDKPLILPTVDAHAVAAVVGDWTGIPVGRMVKNEIEAVLKLAETLNERVVGQKHALEMIAKRKQEEAGKDQMIAELQNLGKVLERIIVVSHQDDVQSNFPNRWHIFSQDGTSQAQLEVV